MPENRTRHLAAVVFTDLVGYTALMQRDEAAALRARAQHRSVLQEIVPKHHGRLVQFMGDGSLCLFPSSVSAVAAALEIQRIMAENPTLPLRVGIDEGEVAYDDQGVYGHCVNRASRIEGVAVPGSVCVSEKVYQELHNQPTFSGEVIGEFELKNVDAPVRVFRIRDPTERTQPAELLLLGGVSLKLRGEPVSGRSAQRRRMAFLALLSAAPHGVMSRDKVVGYLWPDTDPQKARRLLSEALYVIRKSLGEDSVVATGGELRLNHELVWSDVASYQEALSQGELAKAVQLYAGPFLDGFYVDDAIEFDHWVDSARDRMAREYAEALDTLARRAEEAGDPSAVRWWRDLIRFDPLDAAVAVRYMEALEGAGRRAEALQFAKKHAQLLREEFDAEPNPQVEALAGRLRESPVVAPLEERPAGPPTPGPKAPAVAQPAASSQPAEALVVARASSKASSRRRWAVGLAIVSTVVAGAWGVSRTAEPSAEAAPAAPGVVVAVFPFEGDADLVPLWKILSDNLGDAGDVTSVAYVTVSARLNWREGGQIGLEEADSLAGLMGANHFTLSTISAAEGQLQLSVTVFETGHPDVPPLRHRVSAAADQPLTLVNQMALELLPSLSSNPTALLEVVSQTTDSLEAFRAFHEGETAFLFSRFDEAVRHFSRALEIDPTPAWIHYRLSQAYEWNEQYMEAVTSAESARERSATLKPHDRKLIEAWDNLVRGDAERAEALYLDILFTWPNDVEGLLGMVKVAMFHNPRRGRSRAEALGYLNLLREVAPAFGDIHFHLMEFAAAAGDRARFDSLQSRLDGQSTLGRAWATSGDLAWNRGDQPLKAHLTRVTDPVEAGFAAGQLASFFRAPELADSLVEEFGSRPEVTGDVRAMTFILSAQLDMAQGQWVSGISELRRAQAAALGWALELEALYSGIPGRGDQRDAADVAHRAVEAWTPSPADDSQNTFLHVHTGMHDAIRLYVLGLTDVWRGTPQDADDDLADLRRIPPTTSEGRLASQLVVSLMAHQAAAMGDSETALAWLGQVHLITTLPQLVASPFYTLPHDRLLRADLHLQRGEFEDAARWYLSLTELWDYPYFAPGHLGLARTYHALGLQEQSEEHYQTAAAFLLNADSSAKAMLEDVGATLGALPGEAARPTEDSDRPGGG